VGNPRVVREVGGWQFANCSAKRERTLIRRGGGERGGKGLR